MPLSPMAQSPPRKRWTRAECERLEALGIFDQLRLELIEGELIDRTRKNRPHVGVATLLMAWMIEVFEARQVNVGAPIDVAPEDNPTNQPVPDLIVLKPNYAGFWSRTPQPHDLDLVVEIADSPMAFDFTIKAELYDRAGITEYRLLDVSGRCLIVHREPQSGRYALVTSCSEHETVAPLSAPSASFLVQTVFPS
jgi:Uma2 family endonuclease